MLFRDIFLVFAYVFEYFIIFYSIAIVSSYLILAVISAFRLSNYRKENDFVDYKRIMTSPLAPSISVVTPAKNEEKAILEHIRSLRTLQYPKLEIVIVNDGSDDDSMKILTENLELERTDFAVEEKAKSAEIKGIYRSTNELYRNIIIVDKESGGTKSDAMNAGLNVASGEYILDIDADSILQHDTLLKLVKPILESDKKVLGVGGVLGIANSCEVKEGKLVNVVMPKKFLPRMQAIEYLRSFLAGRMAWSKLNGIIIISGALGLFEKQALLKSGGFDPKASADDMETGVRLRKFMDVADEEYEMHYVPEPLCWTEVPSTVRAFISQRSRWGRGILETLWKHKTTFFNPKHGTLGWIGFPFAFFFEWLAPIIEILGLTYFIIAAILGMVNWDVFFMLLGSIYIITVFFSSLALLYEESMYHQYDEKKDMWKWIGTAFLEPFLFHPINLVSMLRGDFQYVTGRRHWSTLEREGFERKEK